MTLRNYKRILPLVLALGPCLCLTGAGVGPSVGPSSQGYQIHEEEKSIDLSTPYGAKEITGGVGAESYRYHIEIPLDSLKPTPTPTPQAQSDTDKEAAELAKDLKGEKMGGDGTGDGDDGDDDDDDDGNAKRAPSSVAEKPTPPPVPTVDYDDSDRLILEANHLYNRGKFYEASIYVDELVRKKPKYSRGWIMKGSLLWMLGHKDLAKEAWQQAQALAPDSQEVKDLLQRYR